MQTNLGIVALAAIIFAAGCATTSDSGSPPQEGLSVSPSVDRAAITTAYLEGVEGQNPLEDFGFTTACSSYTGLGQVSSGIQNGKPMAPRPKQAVESLLVYVKVPGLSGLPDPKATRDFLRRTCLKYQIKYYWDAVWTAESKADNCSKVDSPEAVSAMAELIAKSNLSQKSLYTYTITPEELRATWQGLCSEL